LQSGHSVNKHREALLEAARGMQQWLWQLSPQGGGLSHKLIERSHMIVEFHLEPSRYIKPHRNEEFRGVPFHFPKSPHITCMIVTLCPLLPHLCASCKSQSLARAHPGSITTMQLSPLFSLKLCPTYEVVLLFFMLGC